MANTGVFSDMGLNRILLGKNPSFSSLPLASTYASSIGALGIIMSLYARTFHGQGNI